MTLDNLVIDDLGENEDAPECPENPLGSITLSDPMLELGQKGDITATVTNHSQQTMKNVKVNMAVPEGWKPENPSDDKNFEIEPGKSIEIDLTVVPDGKAKPGQYQVVMNATFEVDGQEAGTSSVAFLQLLDPLVIPYWQMKATATSEQAGADVAKNAIDGNPSTMWHTDWSLSDPLPQSITLDLGGTYDVNKVSYLPR